MMLLLISAMALAMSSSVPDDWPQYSSYGSQISNAINKERSNLNLAPTTYDYLFMSELDIYKQVQVSNWFSNVDFAPDLWQNLTITGPLTNYTRTLKTNAQLIFYYATFDVWRSYGYNFCIQGQGLINQLKFRTNQRDCFDANLKLKGDFITETGKRCSWAFLYYPFIANKDLSRISCIEDTNKISYCYCRF